MHTPYYWGTPEADQAIQTAFLAHKAILAESDTIWGLFSPISAWGAAELDRLKERRDKPYLVIMDSVESAFEKIILQENGTLPLIKQFWPGPLTILVHARQNMLHEARSIENVIGIRVPAHIPLRACARIYGGLFSTSANISGQPVPTTFDEIPASIRTTVGATIYNAPDYHATTEPSTIIDCTGTALKIIRHGAIAALELDPFLYNQ